LGTNNVITGVNASHNTNLGHLIQETITASRDDKPKFGGNIEIVEKI
jgi:hypothetical protein